MVEKMSWFTRHRKTRIYCPQKNKGLPKRLNWEQIEAQPRQEGRQVVKGTAKRVIVVKSPNPKIFEQAIFIVREDAGKEFSGPSDVLKEAQKVANDYIRASTPGPGRIFARLPKMAFAAAGAFCVGLAWALFMLLGA